MSNQVSIFGAKFTTLDDKAKETTEVRYGFLIKDNYDESHVEIYEYATDLREDLKPKNIFKTLKEYLVDSEKWIKAIKLSNGVLINRKWYDCEELGEL